MSNLTTSLRPLSEAWHSSASNVFLFNLLILLIKTISARIFQVSETKRHFINLGVLTLSKISSPTCGIPRLITLSIVTLITCFLVGVQSTNDASLAVLDKGLPELPDFTTPKFTKKLSKIHKFKQNTEIKGFSI